MKATAMDKFNLLERPEDLLRLTIPADIRYSSDKRTTGHPPKYD